MTIRIHKLQKEPKVYNHLHNDKKRKNQKYITTLQHFAALHHTSPNYTSLHLSTLHSLTFTLHYPLICLNKKYFKIHEKKKCGPTWHRMSHFSQQNF